MRRHIRQSHHTAHGGRTIGTPLVASSPQFTVDDTSDDFRIGSHTYQKPHSDRTSEHTAWRTSAPEAVFVDSMDDMEESASPSQTRASLVPPHNARVVAPAFRIAPSSRTKVPTRPWRTKTRHAKPRTTPRRHVNHTRIGGQRIMHRDQFSLRDIPIFHHKSMLVFHNISRRYAMVMGIVLACVIGAAFVATAFAVKARIDDAGHDAVASLKMAMASMNQKDFTASQEDLDHAYAAFATASQHMGRMGSVVTYVSQFIPGASKLASGNHMVQAGALLTHAAKELHGVLPHVMESGADLKASDGIHISFLALYQMIADRLDVAYTDVHRARVHMDSVRFDDVPNDYRDMFIRITDLLPQVEASLENVRASRSAIEDVLGAHGPRTYLLLFQNNHEMRATGGFIGSYGIVKITDGYIDKIMVDDIYNPDGQLIDKIVPPLPIQKISANWSMHDSNWFPDYPVSARAVMDLYERTGGPTVDGVIALTPTVIQDMLAVTGPVDLPAYNMRLTADNFIDVLQEEIEDRDNYVSEEQKDDTVTDDAETEAAHDDDADVTAEASTVTDDETVNAAATQEDSGDTLRKQPKKVLSDLMPILLDRILAFDDLNHIAALTDIVSRGLQQRHVLMYVSDDKGEDIILRNGWGGAIEQTDTDYLSVINTNINGFKTDGMVDETITHTTRIDTDGGIVDTVQITRVHNGGHTDRPWWDAVNANYMRIYVPEGSQLVSVEGQTRETMSPRLDYDALGYERNEAIVREESAVRIDANSGTRVYTDAGKTVFADWVYVSPQESVTVTYTYKLPFTITFDKDAQGAFGSYGLLVQKQAGSTNTAFAHTLTLPDGYTSVWQSDDDNDAAPRPLSYDRFSGTVFRLP